MLVIPIRCDPPVGHVEANVLKIAILSPRFSHISNKILLVACPSIVHLKLV